MSCAEVGCWPCYAKPQWLLKGAVAVWLAVSARRRHSSSACQQMGLYCACQYRAPRWPNEKQAQQLWGLQGASLEASCPCSH